MGDMGGNNTESDSAVWSYDTYYHTINLMVGIASKMYKFVPYFESICMQFLHDD